MIKTYKRKDTVESIMDIAKMLPPSEKEADDKAHKNKELHTVESAKFAHSADNAPVLKTRVHRRVVHGKGTSQSG